MIMKIQISLQEINSLELVLYKIHLLQHQIIVLTADKASAVTALKLVGTGYSEATFTADAIVTQTVGTGQTAAGKVVSYDKQQVF